MTYVAKIVFDMLRVAAALVDSASAAAETTFSFDFRRLRLTGKCTAVQQEVYCASLGRIYLLCIC
jgi:hypothetical protein